MKRLKAILLVFGIASVSLSSMSSAADEDWQDPDLRCFGVRLAGDGIGEVDSWGKRVVDDTLLILLNAQRDRVTFTLPLHRTAMRWELVLDTREAQGRRKQRLLRKGEGYELEAHSLALLRLR